MKIYMLPIGAEDASFSPVEVDLSASAQIGDVVLGMISINGGPGGIGSNVLDESSHFASIVTESSTSPGAAVLVQNSQNLNGVRLIALMQRGNFQA